MVMLPVVNVMPVSISSKYSFVESVMAFGLTVCNFVALIQHIASPWAIL
jgi:hypothetical protein